jgi:hypothetical protein
MGMGMGMWECGNVGMGSGHGKYLTFQHKVMQNSSICGLECHFGDEE